MQPQICLYVARHGRTVLNEQNIFRGNLDPPLDKNGFRDANELAYYFNPIELSFIVSSEKQRALITADIIYLSKKTNLEENIEFLKPISNGLLAPWNIGDFGGKPKDKENIAKLQKYVDNPMLTVPGGSSLEEFRSRIRPLFYEAVEVGNSLGVPGLLVVHSSLIHEVGEAFGSKDAHVKPGGVIAVYITDSGLSVQPIFKPDKKATTQNVLGTGKQSSLNS
jgi:broad specificity phosphatase PhoE